MVWSDCIGFCLRVAGNLNFVGCIRISYCAIKRRWSVTACSFLRCFCLALPDIVPDVDMLQADMKIQIIPLEYLRCPLEENCLSPSADFLIRYYSFYDLTVIVWMPVRLSIHRVWVIFEHSLKNYTSLEASAIWKNFQISYAVLRTRVNLHRSAI